MNHNDHAASIPASNYITVLSYVVHKVKIFTVDDGRSWKSRRRSWMRKNEEVELYISKTTRWTQMP